jgi:hypothetical protein
MNATKRPSAEIAGSKLPYSAAWPAQLTFTSVVAPLVRSWRKTFGSSSRSASTSSSDSPWKTTKRPSAEIEGTVLSPSCSWPNESTLTRVVAPVV